MKSHTINLNIKLISYHKYSYMKSIIAVNSPMSNKTCCFTKVSIYIYDYSGRQLQLLLHACYDKYSTIKRCKMATEHNWSLHLHLQDWIQWPVICFSINVLVSNVLGVKRYSSTFIHLMSSAPSVFVR